MDIDDWAVGVFAVEHIGRGSPRCAGEQFFHVETVFGPMRIGGTCRRESQLPLLLHLRLKRVPDSLHARVHAGPESVECESDFSRNRKRQRIGQTRIRVSAIRSEEHTSELQSLMRNSYAVFCLKKT